VLLVGPTIGIRGDAGSAGWWPIAGQVSIVTHACPAYRLWPVEGSGEWLWASGASMCAAALVVGIAAGLPAGRALDKKLYAALNRPQGRVADALFGGVTDLGSIWASAGSAAVVATVGRRKREALDAMGAALAMWAVGQGLKRAFTRPRPYDALEPFRLMIAKPRGTSWPSSHPAVLLAFGTVLARDLRAPRSLARRLGALAGVVGLSRVYLGVHYPADVAGGLLLGRGVADLWTRAVSSRVLSDPNGLRRR
jgi:membrane-associated phospholipid phosphatase